MAISEPRLEQRGAQPYVGMRRQVTMRQIGKVLPPLTGEVFAWLAARGVKPAGAPFWRYLVTDMKGKLEIDVAVPVSTAIAGDASVVADALPPGRYAVVLHVGHPDSLMQATADLLSWAEGKGIRWKREGTRWAGRVEWYFSNPVEEPDLNKWRTELAFLTA